MDGTYPERNVVCGLRASATIINIFGERARDARMKEIARRKNVDAPGDH